MTEGTLRPGWWQAFCAWWGLGARLGRQMGHRTWDVGAASQRSSKSGKLLIWGWSLAHNFVWIGGIYKAPGHHSEWFVTKKFWPKNAGDKCHLRLHRQPVGTPHPWQLCVSWASVRIFPRAFSGRRAREHTSLDAGWASETWGWRRNTLTFLLSAAWWPSSTEPQWCSAHWFIVSKLLWPHLIPLLPSWYFRGSSPKNTYLRGSLWSPNLRHRFPVSQLILNPGMVMGKHIGFRDWGPAIPMQG